MPTLAIGLRRRRDKGEGERHERGRGVGEELAFVKGLEDAEAVEKAAVRLLVLRLAGETGGGMDDWIELQVVKVQGKGGGYLCPCFPAAVYCVVG